MSRIGLKPIEIPKGVEVNVKGREVSGKGPAGELSVSLPSSLDAKVDGGKLTISPIAGQTDAGKVHGTYRTVVANMVQGLAKPFVKELEIQGVGFKAQLQGQKLVLALGFSHPIEFPIPAGIKIAVNEGTALTVSGANKQMVGQVSSIIRGYFPAEPYKGKGVRLKGEYVRRKAGKAVA